MHDPTIGLRSPTVDAVHVRGPRVGIAQTHYVVVNTSAGQTEPDARRNVDYHQQKKYAPEGEP